MPYSVSFQHRADHRPARQRDAIRTASGLFGEATPPPMVEMALSVSAAQHALQTRVLACVPLLQSLAPAVVLALLHHAALRRLPRQAVVVEQGCLETSLFFLVSGQAQVVRNNQRGRSLVLEQLRPGASFGELSAIDDQPQFATVRCTMPSEVLVIPRGDFIQSLHESPALLSRLMQVMVDRVRRKNRRIALLALHDVHGCVVQQLLDLADLQDGVPTVRGRICRQAIADMIGASRAMVSRVMMALLRSGEIVLLPDGSTAVHCAPGHAPARRPRKAAASARTDA